MSEPSEASAAEEARPIQVPVDPVDFEARLLAVERRLAGYETRDQALLEAIEAVHRLTDVVGTLMRVVHPTFEPRRPVPTERRWAPQARGSEFASAIASQPVSPERLAHAQERLRETLFAPTESGAADAPAVAPPPRSGRKSWMRHALKRMVKEDPPAAGQLLLALLPAHGLAGQPPVSGVPWPPATVARLLVVGRLRRRLGWERAGLECTLKALSELAPLVRLGASPRDLYTAGVRLDASLALRLVAYSISPAWTAGHRFTIAHGTSYLSIRDGRRPSVGTEPPPGPVAATVFCAAPALLAVLAGEGATVEGDRGALELVQQWFARATSR